MGQGSISKLDLSEADRELLRFTWRVVANADDGTNPPQLSSLTSASKSSLTPSNSTKDDDDASEHSFSSETDDSLINLGTLMHKKVFHFAYEKFFKLSPASCQIFPENKMKMGDILKVILNMGTNHDAATIKRLVSVHKEYKLSKQQFEAFARTIEYKLDKLCTVYVAKLWERVCMGVAMLLYCELKKEGATSE